MIAGRRPGLDTILSLALVATVAYRAVDGTLGGVDLLGAGVISLGVAGRWMAMRYRLPTWSPSEPYILRLRRWYRDRRETEAATAMTRRLSPDRRVREQRD